MPRKSTNTSARANQSSTISVERESFTTRVKAFFGDDRIPTILGILLATFTIFAAGSVLSFFFTGEADLSLLSATDEALEDVKESYQNWLGEPGAKFARWLVDGTFGLTTICFILLGVVYSLRLFNKMPEAGLRFFFLNVFWIFWGSYVLGFIQRMFNINIFFRLGGAFGEWSANGLTTYVHPFGSILLILASLIIFLVLTAPGFIPLVERIWDKLTARFHKTDDEDIVDETSIPESAETEPTVNDGQDGPIEVTFGHTDGDIAVTTTEENGNSEESAPIAIQIEPVISNDAIITDEETDENIAEDGENRENTEDEDDNEEKSIDSENGNSELQINESKEIEIVDDDDTTPEALLRKLGPFDPRKDLEFFHAPTLDLLKVYPNETAPVINQEEQQSNANRIVTTLRNYGIEIDSIKATVGPTVTLYEVVPKAGTRINKIQQLENDIMMSLSATGIRIIAPIPGKGTVGIEVPNESPQTVSMHSVIASKRFQDEQKMRLPVAIGRTITNEVFMFDLAKTPHLLVAGATGQGKSVAINAIITSLLYKKHPAEMKLVMVDPKMVEFAPYKPMIRHYLAAMPDVEPEQVVITECDKVVNTLNSLVIEMENRYKLLMDAGVRNLEDYNDKFVNRQLNPEKVVADTLHHRFLPYIVIIIDEYGDFIMQAGKQVETPIARITQKARAVGMHMILATQRPSVNIVTGVIKANIPTRIALRTQSVIDSRTVLDVKGAEQLIGRGDMLYAGNGNVTRIQCAFVDTPEVDRIVAHVAEQQHYSEPYQLPEYVGEAGDGDTPVPGSVDMKRLDAMFAEVARYVVNKQEGSTSRLQRAFEIGYNRAGKLSDQLEAAGIVGPNKGPKGRDVLIQDPEALEQLLQSLGVQ